MHDNNELFARWDACWVRLLDGLLQAGWVQAGSENMRLPTRIRRLAIPAPCTAPAAGAEGVPIVTVQELSVECCLAMKTC